MTFLQISKFRGPSDEIDDMGDKINDEHFF